MRDPEGVGLLTVAGGMVTSVWSPALAVLGVALGLAALAVAAARRLRARRQGPPRVAVVLGAAPLREPPEPPLTVGAVTGAPWGVQPIAPAGEPAGPRLRVVGEEEPAADAPALVAEAWTLASRRHGQLVDAAAVELGLADHRPAPVPITDPDPVLFSATGWEARAA